MDLHDEESEFSEEPASDERVAERPPFPLYTFIFLAMIAAVFVVQYITSTDPNFFSMDRVSALAAGFDKRAFWADGEYWRILTGATVHSGILHALLNGYALYIFGRLVETLSNGAHLSIVIVLSALGGGLLSFFLNPDAVSVGASGGIVGLIGYLAVYAFKRKQFISAEFRRSLLYNIAFILLFGLLLFNVIDNFGHIGGLVTGAVYGLVQIPSDEYVDPRVAGVAAKVAGIASVAIYGAACVLTILLLFAAKQ